MKRFVAFLLVIVIILTLAACGKKTTDETPTGGSAETTPDGGKAAPNGGEPSGESGEPVSDGTLTEDAALTAMIEGTLVADDQAGYSYSESTGNWYYSNYPGYKDFNADGKLKVAFVCKSSDTWFTTMDAALAKTIENAGGEYLFVSANSNEKSWQDGIDTVIEQNFDAVVMTPVNTDQLPGAIEKLQSAGIAYMTVDDSGMDAYEFYAPHYGLDDYHLHNELGKYVAGKIEEENWMEDVAEDYSNLMLVIQDDPANDSIHLRNEAFLDGILESYAIPEDNVVWLNSGNALTGKSADEFFSLVQDNEDVVDKWIVSAGGTSSFAATIELFEDADVDLSNVKFAGAFSTDEPLKMMMEDSDVAACSYGVYLSAAISGVDIGNILIDLFRNGSPIPGFTCNELIIADSVNCEKLYSELYGE